MANPQKENGFTAISNELFEKIIEAGFNGTQYAIVFSTIRATYGFQKTSKQMGIGYYARLTGRGKRQLTREVRNLIKRNVLIVKKGYTQGSSRELKLNKDYEAWLDERGCSLKWI